MTADLTVHRPFGGSTIARDIACPANKQLGKKVPKKKANPTYADPGSLKHNVMQKVYESDTKPDDLIGVETYNETVLTREMVVEDIMPMIKATDDLLDRYDIDETFCEIFVELVPGEAGGSIDMLGVSHDGKTVVVLDYKTGFHQVSPVDNDQLKFYALCAMVDPKYEQLFKDCERLVMAIIQPIDGECTAKIWDTTPDILDSFEDEVYKTIDRSKMHTDPQPGDHCKWCPAEAICPAKTGEARKALMLAPTDLATIAEALPMVDALEAWCKAVKTTAHEQLEAGNQIAGYKLVNKRASRVWNDPDAALTKVKHAKNLKLEEACDIKLKSPPQMEKLCKAKGIPFKPYQTYISALSSGTTLARADDKRPEALALNASESLVHLTS